MNYWELTPADFPEGEPALKMKKGLWYRPNNCGYTDRVLEAGIYPRQDVINDCFDENNKNGCYEVIGVPIRLALKGITKMDIVDRMIAANSFMQYAEDKI